MPDNLLQIVDLGSGQIQITWSRDHGAGTATRVYPTPLPFANPLADEDRAELRWYLEDFVAFPYGAEPDRAARVEERMREWGTALFRQAFPIAEDDPSPRGFYHEAVRDGLEYCDLAIISDDPAFLNI